MTEQIINHTIVATQVAAGNYNNKMYNINTKIMIAMIMILNMITASVLL